MENFIAGLLTQICAQTAGRIMDRLIIQIHQWGQHKRASEIRAFLEQIGHATEPHIRKMVFDWLQRHPHESLSEADAEEVIAVLSNLARGARIQNTQGVIRSSFIRNIRLLEELLTDVRPTRRRGERVAEQSDWVLERYLGMGTFGEVWMVRNGMFPKPRACKFFTRGEAMRMIRNEAATLYHVLNQLGQHPNVVEFHDVVLNCPGNPYIVLEYVEGGSLEDWILEDKEERAPLNRFEIMRGIIEGLAMAHEKQIYHRDMKPANIILTSGNCPIPKITDFGLGRAADQRSSMVSAQISISDRVGTAMYLPPEAQSIADNRSEAKDDVFALGVIWYQLLVERIERPPYDFAEELRLAGVESHTIRIISRCLARPEHRFSSAVMVRDSMEDMPRDWKPPKGLLDVSGFFRQYHAAQVS